MTVYALYYKKEDGKFEGPAVAVFESESKARKYVYDDAACPKTEFEIIEFRVH
jgi:hypothetical protein